MLQVEKPAKAKQTKQETPVQERRRYSTDPKTFHALLALAAESTAPKVSQAITRAIAQAMLSDLCFLMYLTDNKNQMIIASGYDLIREENLEGGSLDKNAIPMLANSIQRGRPLRMPASSTSADIKGLSELLGLQNPGNLLAVPIVTAEKDSIGGIILLSPYSNRLWSAEDQAFLVNIAGSLVPIIQRSQKMSKLEQTSEQAKQALDAAQSRIAELEKQSDELRQQMDATKSQSEKEAAQEENVAALLVVQEESQRTIEQLQKELEAARGKGRGTKSQVERELKVSLQDVRACKTNWQNPTSKYWNWKKAARPHITDPANRRK